MNNEIPFTKRRFEQLDIESKRYRVADIKHRDSIKGLILEVLPSGRKVFRFRRNRLGRDVHVTIGEFPNITIENARKLAKNIASEIAEGRNPNETKRQQQIDDELKRSLSMTIQQLFDAFEVEFELKIKSGLRRIKSLKDIHSLWRNHLQERVGHLAIGNISPQEANNLLKLILTKNSVSVRNKCLTLMKSMFADQDTNPFIKIKKLGDTKRERILSQLEVKELLEALKYEEPIYSDVVMALLLTGQRKSCVFSMAWKEIDHKHGIWVIPTSKMKGNKPHAVPLTVEMMEVLKHRSAEANRGEKYVFPSSRSISGHITEKSGKGSFWWRIRERAGLYSVNKDENVTIHDLRRTTASWNVMRGGNLQTTSKLLGHSNINITDSTYAHLDVEQVRAELGITTAQLLGTAVQEPKMDELAKAIKQLSEKERRELFDRLS
jgi:integrase